MNKKVEILLKDIVRIPSESGNERELGEFIARLLEKRYKVVKQPVGKRFNILASIGNPSVLMNAHLDTVPGKLEIKEDDEFIYGRGTCDTKGSIASMIAAGDVLLDKGMSDFGFLFDVSEETNFEGMKEAVKIIPESVKTVIVGEPTSLDMVVGQKGILVFKIICRGKAAHGSNPDKGENAIELLCEKLADLKKLKLPSDKFLGENIINIAKISGGKADNIVPDYAEATVGMRCSLEPKKILERLRRELKPAEIDVSLNYGVFANSGLNKLADALRISQRTVSYFTEAYFLSKKASTFIFGPGDVAYAHSDNEKVEKKELELASVKYVEIITYLNQAKLAKKKEEEK